MPTPHEDQDSHHLDRVLKMAAKWVGDLGLGATGADGALHQSYTSSIDAVAVMLERLQKAESTPTVFLELACDILRDHGFKPQGVKHTDDPEGMVTSTITLNSDHLSDDAHKYLKALSKHDSRVSYAAGNSSTGDFVAMLTVGELPDDAPYALVEAHDIAIMRCASYLHFTPEGPFFPGLKTY